MTRSPAAHESGPVDPADRGRAFTLELRRRCAPDLCGRLTYVATGETAHFDSGDELVALLQRYSRGGAASS